MHVAKVSIQGYKGINNDLTVKLSDGLNIIVGENASGKSTVIDAIKLILREDEYMKGIKETDFHKPFDKDSIAADSFSVKLQFDELTEREHVALLPWTGEIDGSATLKMSVANKQNYYGRYTKSYQCGAASAGKFEHELLEMIHCIYLPPLRDAEARLTEGRGSRLARLIKNFEKDELTKCKRSGTKHQLENKFADFNRDLKENDAIVKINSKIKEKLEKAIGSTMGQETDVQFSDVGFNKIVESLRLLFFPTITAESSNKVFRSLEENSLGYNNLIYLATVLAELESVASSDSLCKVLLIEEPEAHLHPQLQIKLLKYLEGVVSKKKKKEAKESTVDAESTQDESSDKNDSEDNYNNIQIVVTTHSPVLSSSTSIKNLIQMNVNKDYEITSTSLADCEIPEKSVLFLNRWLDATKANLLFAKGIILVEGIAEAMLLPVLAKRVLKKYNDSNSMPESLEEAGVSVINVNGTHFKHFLPLFMNLDNSLQGDNIPILCSVLTDRDPEKESYPSIEDIINNGNSDDYKSNNPMLDSVAEINNSENSQIYFSPLKTFEYDLVYHCGNQDMIGKLWYKNWKREKLSTIQGNAEKIYKSIKSTKGEFAQVLADKLDDDSECKFELPKYIEDAVLWACGISIEQGEDDNSVVVEDGEYYDSE